MAQMDIRNYMLHPCKFQNSKHEDRFFPRLGEAQKSPEEEHPTATGLRMCLEIGIPLEKLSGCSFFAPVPELEQVLPSTD